MSAQINACAGEWITEQKCHLPSPENRTNKQAARSSSKLDPAPSGSRSIILGSCNRLQASAKARRLSRATAQMLGIFALATLSHFRREIYSLIKTVSSLWFRGYKNLLPWKKVKYTQSKLTPLLYLVNQKPSHDPSNVAEAQHLCLLLRIDNISYLLASSTQTLAEAQESTPKKNLPLYEVPGLEADLQTSPKVLDPKWQNWEYQSEEHEAVFLFAQSQEGKLKREHGVKETADFICYK